MKETQKQEVPEKYTISEMATLLGVSTHTLRYYEKIGILAPEVNEQTGYRYYTVLDTRQFNLSRQLFSAGVPAPQQRTARPAHTVPQLMALVAR